jgi:hypothetical protein
MWAMWGRLVTMVGNLVGNLRRIGNPPAAAMDNSRAANPPASQSSKIPRKPLISLGNRRSATLVRQPLNPHRAPVGGGLRSIAADQRASIAGPGNSLPLTPLRQLVY